MWKNLSYWLRGSIIGIVIGFILYVISILGIYPKIFSKTIWAIFNPVCYLPGMASEADITICFVIFGLPGNLIIYGVFGLIVGLLIGLIKNRKEN